MGLPCPTITWGKLLFLKRKGAEQVVCSVEVSSFKNRNVGDIKLMGSSLLHVMFHNSSLLSVSATVEFTLEVFIQTHNRVHTLMSTARIVDQRVKRTTTRNFVLIKHIATICMKIAKLLSPYL